MGFVKKGNKSQIRYNSLITIAGIPLEAYEYVVFGKSAIEWVMERQAVTTHKDSGIVNDANDWACEAMGNPSYPLELLQKIITLSLKTQKIVKSLPPLDLHPPQETKGQSKATPQRPCANIQETRGCHPS